MGEPSRRIKSVLLRVDSDPGHGGTYSEYRIDPGEGDYTVTLRISGPAAEPGGDFPPAPTPPSQSPPALPAPVVNRPARPQAAEVLAKDNRQVEEFLGKLSAEFDVYGLADLRSPHPFLHPTFYSFSFRDCAGAGHGFEYQIECSNHPDERYGKLIRAFESFFESARVFDKFFEARRRGR